MTSRNYCFTAWNLDIWNQPNISRIISSTDHRVRYLVFQIEICPDTQRHHAQGYLELTSPLRQIAVKKTFSDDSMHIESREGSRDQARHYCMCSGPPCPCPGASRKQIVSGPFEFGEWTTRQGQRTDLLSLQSAIDQRVPMHDIAQQHFGSFLRYERAVRSYQTLSIPPRSSKTELHIVWGPAGSGKAYHCFSQHPPGSFYRISFSPSAQPLFNDYDPSIHENILITGFYGWIDLPFLLQLCDQYPLQVKVLYGSAQFVAKRIYITAYDSPLYWYLPPNLISAPDPKSHRPFHSVDLVSLLTRITSIQHRTGHWHTPVVRDDTRSLQKFLYNYFHPPLVLKDGKYVSVPPSPLTPETYPDFLRSV